MFSTDYLTNYILNFKYRIVNQVFDCILLDYIHHLTISNNLMIDIVD